MKGILYLLLVLFILAVVGCASRPAKGSTPTAVLTHHQFSDLDSLMSKEPRPVAVFLHTDWCKYCRNMEQTTFQNEEVIELLNQQYYFIAFDGEQKGDVIFRNHLFRYQPTGRNTGTHELAVALGTMEGGLAYPAFVVLSPRYEVMFQHNAFLSAEAVVGILQKE